MPILASALASAPTRNDPSSRRRRPWPGHRRARRGRRGVQATFITRSTPRVDKLAAVEVRRPWERRQGIAAESASAVRRSGPGTWALVVHGVPTQRAAGRRAARRAPTRSRTTAVGSPDRPGGQDRPADRRRAGRADRSGRATARTAGCLVRPQLRRRTARRRRRVDRPPLAHGHGVGARTSLEPCRVHRTPAGSMDAHRAGLERLPQRVESTPLELGGLIEEQHAMMGQRDGPGRRDARATADQGGNRRRVVRGAERRAGEQRTAGRQPTEQRVDRADRQCLVIGQVGKQTGQSLGEHRLADPGWTGEQQVVTARRGDLHRMPRLTLAHHIGQIRVRPGIVTGDGRRRRRGRPARRAAARTAPRASRPPMTSIARDETRPRGRCPWARRPAV